MYYTKKWNAIRMRCSTTPAADGRGLSHLSQLSRCRRGGITDMVNRRGARDRHRGRHGYSPRARKRETSEVASLKRNGKASSRFSERTPPGVNLF